MIALVGIALALALAGIRIGIFLGHSSHLLIRFTPTHVGNMRSQPLCTACGAVHPYARREYCSGTVCTLRPAGEPHCRAIHQAGFWIAVQRLTFWIVSASLLYDTKQVRENFWRASKTDQCK